MQNQKIPYTQVSITDLERDLVHQAQAHHDPYYFVDLFEERWAQHVGVKHAIATSSCTGALTLGYAAQGLSAGDEVIMADSNWVATAAPLHHLSVRIKLVDIEPESWCIDPQQVSSAITRKTRAIIVTHLYGNLADMTALETFNLPLVEDAAEAIGSSYQAQAAGSMGIWGAYSFHSTKTMSTGEGGMFVTNDTELYHRARCLSNHGRTARRDTLHAQTLGYKFKMSNMQAAQGVAQLQRVNDLVNRKREIFEYYRCHIDDRIKMNPVRPRCEHGHWLPVAVFPNRPGRDRMLHEFAKAGIDTRQFFSPLSMIADLNDGTVNPVAQAMPDQAINLPSFHDITSEQLSYVVDTVNRLVKEFDRS